MTKITLFGAVAAIALCSPCLAQAQAAAQGTAQLPELIVTAERRESNVQDVPATVSAFSSEMLERANITDTRDLTRITPGLNVAQSSFVTQPTIRGVGSRSTAPGDESNVAVYIDGVYQTDMYALSLDLDNIERVEVLKGPQGT
ncbi:MAG: TonB-dependent receptor, partial [Caulobacteraceae bacterium]|nr:TonB-dependent receptor [Caulobacteraceae bacterium]